MSKLDATLLLFGSSSLGGALFFSFPEVRTDVFLVRGYELGREVVGSFSLFRLAVVFKI